MRQFFEIMESFDSPKAILGTLIQQANVYSIFYKSFEPYLIRLRQVGALGLLLLKIAAWLESAAYRDFSKVR